MSREPHNLDLPVEGHRSDTVVSETVIGDSNLVMRGELCFDPDSDLTVVGKIVCTSVHGVRNLTIVESGTLLGNVASTTATISGTLEGSAQVTESVVLKRTARVRGEITAAWISVEQGTNLEGCTLSGKIRPAK